MDMSPIGNIISTSRMGTRIPEELLGLPPRASRQDRTTYSMDPVEPVGRLRTSRKEETAAAQETDVTGSAEALAALIGNATGTADVAAFHDVLQKALEEQRTPSVSRELLSDPEYYRNLMKLSQFSANLISDNLNTFGSSGASAFGLDALS